MEIRTLLFDGTQQLALTSESPRLDCELLLCHCLQKPRSYLFTWPEQLVEAITEQHFRQLLSLRSQGHPIAYLLGEREFWGLSIAVNQHTLIPRPETEQLVELALQQLPAEASADAINLLDLGSGSGAIAIAIATERPDIQITATDISNEALAVARSNAHRHRLTNIRFICSDWFAQLPQQPRFDVIVSNPPYIANDDSHLQQGDLRFEPLNALASGADGLNAIRELIQHAPDYLQPEGWLLMEHGYDQGEKITRLLTEAGYRQVHCQQDFSGLDRISYGQPSLQF